MSSYKRVRQNELWQAKLSCMAFRGFSLLFIYSDAHQKQINLTMTITLHFSFSSLLILIIIYTSTIVTVAMLMLRHVFRLEKHIKALVENLYIRLD
jgi:hypothetical protein